MPFINIEPFKNDCKKIFLRRGLSDQKSFVILEEGELIYLLDSKRIFVGDNINPGGTKVSTFNYINDIEIIDYDSRDSFKNIKDEKLKTMDEGDMVFDVKSGNTYRLFSEIDQCNSGNHRQKFFRNVGCSNTNIENLTGNYLLRSGGIMSGNISMNGGNFVRNIPIPIDDYELANKQYADDRFDSLKNQILAFKTQVDLLEKELNVLLLSRVVPPDPVAINYPPNIVTPLQDLTVRVGSDVKFSVEAYGDGELTYEWYIS